MWYITLVAIDTDFQNQTLLTLWFQEMCFTFISLVKFPDTWPIWLRMIDFVFAYEWIETYIIKKLLVPLGPFRIQCLIMWGTLKVIWVVIKCLWMFIYCRYYWKFCGLPCPVQINVSNSNWTFLGFFPLASHPRSDLDVWESPWIFSSH